MSPIADDVPITAGSGTSIGADNISSVYYQRVKLIVGPDGTNTGDTAGRTVDGGAGAAVYVDNRPKVTRISVTPTVSTSPAYSLKDCVGSYMTFANAVRASGGSGRVQRVQVVDLNSQLADLDLLLFDRSISGTSTATDNAAFDLADADCVKLVGIIPVGGGYYGTFVDDSVADVPCDVPFVLSGTADLTGLLIARGTPTFASTSDIVVSLHIVQD